MSREDLEDLFEAVAPAVVDRLRAMRGPGERYSDVIIRIARG